MRYVRYGTTDLTVSRLCLGTWVTGGLHWGGTEERAAVEAIRAARGLGVNFFDTAPVYGFGRSEELLAEGLKGVPRDEVVLATKWGLTWDSAGKIGRLGTRARCRQEIEDSLRRLRTNYIDIYMLHWPDPNTPIEEGMEAMAELVEEGKVRYVGGSNFDIPLLERCLKIRKVDSNQPPYSLLRRSREKELFPFCRKNGIGIMVYGPLQHGLLTGKMKADWTFRPGDFRANEPHFTGDVFLRNLRIVEGLREVAESQGRTVAQLAVAWVLANPDVEATIVGARSPEQLLETAPAADWKLTQQDLAAVEDILQRNQPDLVVTGGLMGSD